MPTLSLSNITKYANGPRDIDAAVDAAVNGTPAKQPDAHPQEVKHQEAPHKEPHKATFMEKMHLLFGENETPGAVANPTQVATADLGIHATREGLGPDAAHLSDDHIRQALGNDIVAQIGDKGFPHQEVASIQEGFAQHGLDKMDALQTYVAAVNSQPGDTIELQGQDGSSVSMNSDHVLQVAGLSREEIDQARGEEHSHEGEHAQADAGAEMPMG